MAVAVDALRLVDHVDHVILFMGDGDFRATGARHPAGETPRMIVPTVP
jgi:uncharacterized LabA/DUF88 family protein